MTTMAERLAPWETRYDAYCMHVLGLHCVDQVIGPLILPSQYVEAYTELGMQLVMIPHTVLLHGKPMSTYTAQGRAIVFNRIKDNHDFCIWLNHNCNYGDREELDRVIVDRTAEQYIRANREPHSVWEDRWAVAMSEFSASHVIDILNPTICQLHAALRASTLMQYAEASTNPKQLRPFLLQ